MKIHLYYTYILTNKNHTVLYTGVTNDLNRRCFEHKNKLVKGFTEKYNVNELVYYEMFDWIDLAINREKQIKGYSREKKEALINKFNRDWQNLYVDEKVIKPIKVNRGDSPGKENGDSLEDNKGDSSLHSE